MNLAGLRSRLYTAGVLLSIAVCLAVAGLALGVSRREAALREARLLTAYVESAQPAVVSCRRYLAAVLERAGDSVADSAGQEAVRRLKRSRVLAGNMGSRDEADEIERLGRFIEASRKVLARVEELRGRGKLRQSQAVFEKRLRPLVEDYVADGVGRWIGEEQSHRKDAIQRALRWSQATAAGSAVVLVLAFALFALWTSRFAGYLVRNIESIRRALAAVGSGNFHIALESENKDELGRLAQELNETARRLDRAHKRLVESERLAAYAKIAKGAAHNINNPLFAVLGHTEFLLKRTDLDPEVRQDLETIREQAQRCDVILKSLGQFAREKSSARETVLITQVLEQLVELFRTSFVSAGCALALDLGGECPPVLGHAGDLQQAFFHILNNALRAVRGRSGAKVSVHIRREEGGVAVVVEDNGEGILPENKDRIFEPFFTTRDPGEGAGLGLSIALGIARAHGGDIRVESEPGKGSRFEVRLPAAGSGAGGANSGPVVKSRPSRILVLDDETDILRLVHRVLRREGYEVFCAEEVRAALAAAQEEEPDLVLSDYHLPGINGAMFYKALIELRPRLRGRFIFTTGEIGSKDFQDFAESNHIPILLKPFDLDEMVSAVRTALAPSGK